MKEQLEKNNYIEFSKKNIFFKYKNWMRVVMRRAESVGEIELPIAALIIDQKGRCIGRGTNKRQINKDPLGHAELIALRQAAFLRQDWRFNDCIMLVNLEPCQMCAGALIQARMGIVIFAAKDEKRGGFGGSIDLSKHKSAHHKMKIYGGLLEEDSRKLIKVWFKKLRSDKK